MWKPSFTYRVCIAFGTTFVFLGTAAVYWLADDVRTCDLRGGKDQSSHSTAVSVPPEWGTPSTTSGAQRGG
jgi:hypothetical protein